MDKLNETIKEMAEGYFSLTSRPISTMTVDEYIAFYNLARSGCVIPIPETSTKEHTIPQNQENVTSVPLEDSLTPVKNSVPEKISQFSTQPKREQQPSSKETQLAMLRAVSG